MDPYAVSVLSILGSVILVMAVMAVVMTVVPIIVVAVDTGRYSPLAWQVSGQSRVLVIVITLVTGWIGMLIWYLAMRGQVAQAQQAIDAGLVTFPPAGYSPGGLYPPPGGDGYPPPAS